MKNYNFIPHAANTRSRSQVINLIEAEGATGYGFYWALLEYLRAQKHYIGDIRSIKNIARQMKVRIDKALRILNNYGLFIVEEVDFHSPFLDEKMSLMKRKYDKPCRKNVESVSENDVSVSEVPCNTLEINGASFKEEKRKEEKRKEETTTSSSKEDVADDDVIKQPWESHIDSLRHEEQWKEVMTIRSGHCQNFICRFNKVLQHFKRHRNPKRLHFEQRNPKTKERSYCGVHIPTGAPPKPNNKTERNEETGNSWHKKSSEQKEFRIPTLAQNDATTNIPTFF